MASNFPRPLHYTAARQGREKARTSTQMLHLAPFTAVPVPAVFSQVHREKGRSRGREWNVPKESGVSHTHTHARSRTHCHASSAVFSVNSINVRTGSGWLALRARGPGMGPGITERQEQQGQRGHLTFKALCTCTFQSLLGPPH